MRIEAPTDRPACPTTALRLVDRAPALRRTAPAGHPLDLLREAVVHRQLLASLDRTLTHIQDVAPEVPRVQIRVATVVDILGSAASHRAVERPIIIQRKQVRPLRLA